MMLEDFFKLLLNSMKNIICCYSVLFFLNNTKLIDKFSLIGCTITKINQLNNENSQILKNKTAIGACKICELHLN